MTARKAVGSTMVREARQGFLVAPCCVAALLVVDVGVCPARSALPVAVGAVAGFRDAARLRRHTESSGVRHPFAAQGGMNLFGATVAGAIRRLDRRGS